MLFKTNKFCFLIIIHIHYRKLWKKTKLQRKLVKNREWCHIDRVNSPHFYFKTICWVGIFRDSLLLPLLLACVNAAASLDWCLSLLSLASISTALHSWLTVRRAHLSCELIHSVVLCIILHGTVFCPTLNIPPWDLWITMSIPPKWGHFCDR